jgi:hypothetical protein
MMYLCDCLGQGGNTERQSRHAASIVSFTRLITSKSSPLRLKRQLLIELQQRNQKIPKTQEAKAHIPGVPEMLRNPYKTHFPGFSRCWY